MDVGCDCEGAKLAVGQTVTVKGTIKSIDKKKNTAVVELDNGKSCTCSCDCCKKE